MATRSEPSAAAPVEAAASVEDAPISEDVSAEEAAGVVDAELPQAANMLASSAVLSAAQANFFIILSLSYIGAAILPRP